MNETCCQLCCHGIYIYIYIYIYIVEREPVAIDSRTHSSQYHRITP